MKFALVKSRKSFIGLSFTKAALKFNTIFLCAIDCPMKSCTSKNWWTAEFVRNLLYKIFIIDAILVKKRPVGITY